MATFVKAEDIEIEGERGTLFTYEVMGVTEEISRMRAEVAASARFPSKAGASKIVSVEPSGNGALKRHTVQIFMLSEDLVDKLGVERALDGLKELGILG